MLETGRMQWLRVSHIMPPNYDILRSPVHCRISEGICDDCLGLVQIPERKNDGQAAIHLLREVPAVQCRIFKIWLHVLCLLCDFQTDVATGCPVFIAAVRGEIVINVKGSWCTLHYGYF